MTFGVPPLAQSRQPQERMSALFVLRVGRSRSDDGHQPYGGLRRMHRQLSRMRTDAVPWGLADPCGSVALITRRLAHYCSRS